MSQRQSQVAVDHALLLLLQRQREALARAHRIGESARKAVKRLTRDHERGPKPT